VGGIIFIYLLIYGTLGTVAAVIAAHKGRSKVGWFFAGFFLQIIGIVIVAVLPNLKEQKAYRRHTERERRRLREQLRQERLKSEAYRRYTAQRLDAHDQVLGLDTRSLEALPAGDSGGDIVPIEHNPHPPQPQQQERMWHYEMGGQSHGPVPESEIRNMLRSRILTRRSLVWSEGLTEWMPVGTFPELLPSELT